MPPLLSRRRVTEFQQAFSGEIDSLTALYRNAAGEMLEILADATSFSGQRVRAAALLRQYQIVLANLQDEAAAWIEAYIPRAYGAGLSFVDEAAAQARHLGINLSRPAQARAERAVFSQVHREAIRTITEAMLQTMGKATVAIGRRIEDAFRREGMLAVTKGIFAGKSRVEVSREIQKRLLELGRPDFIDRRGRHWALDHYAEMVARTTTREAMSAGTIARIQEHGLQLAQVSAHRADDFCRYYENVVVCIGPEPHPVYPPISAINGGPPFHPRCVHALTPFVEQLATEEERKAGMVSPRLHYRTPAELQREYRQP